MCVKVERTFSSNGGAISEPQPSSGATPLRCSSLAGAAVGYKSDRSGQVRSGRVGSLKQHIVVWQSIPPHIYLYIIHIFTYLDEVLH